MIGTALAEPTFGSPDMDDKTLNLSRQIEGARRVGSGTSPDRGPELRLRKSGIEAARKEGGTGIESG